MDIKMNVTPQPNSQPKSQPKPKSKRPAGMTDEWMKSTLSKRLSKDKLDSLSEKKRLRLCINVWKQEMRRDYEKIPDCHKATDNKIAVACIFVHRGRKFIANNTIRTHFVKNPFTKATPSHSYNFDNKVVLDYFVSYNEIIDPTLIFHIRYEVSEAKSH